MPVTVRPATTADLPGLLALYAELNPDDPPLRPGTAQAVWASMAAQPGRTVLVATADGTVAGTVDCMILPNLTRSGRPILLVENVVVARSFRRRGVGRRLMDAAVQTATSAGCYKTQLLAADDDEAHAFYQACGFAPLAQGFRRYL